MIGLKEKRRRVWLVIVVMAGGANNALAEIVL